MMTFSFIMYWNNDLFWSLIVKSFITWLNIKFFLILHYVFSLRWLVQVIFFCLNCHHFFFFHFNYHSDFYDSLKSLYIHQMIKNHLINNWNFLDLFICLFVHICIYHYLYCTRIYQSLSLFMIVLHVSTHLYSLCS